MIINFNGSQSYDQGYEEGFASGKALGKTEGIAEQKGRLEETSIVENGVYEREDGWKKVTVDVPTPQPVLEEQYVYLNDSVEEFYPSEGYDGISKITVDAMEMENTAYSNGYNDGIDTGKEEQKALLEEIAITENGTYERNDGYNKVIVDVPQPQPRLQDKYEQIDSSPIDIYPDEGFDGMSSITVDASELENAMYNQGYEYGEQYGKEEQKALLESITITENGTYQREDGYKEVIVDIQGSTPTLNAIKLNSTYIKTNYYPTANTRIQMGVAWYSHNPIKMAFGIFNNSTKNMCFWKDTGTYLSYAYGTSANYGIQPVVFENYYDVEMGNGKVILDGNTVASNLSRTTDTSYDVWIGNCNGTYTTNWVAGSIACSYFKIFEGTELVLDLVPCKDENDVFCLKDTLSDSYYYAVNMGSVEGIYSGPMIQERKEVAIPSGSTDITVNPDEGYESMGEVYVDASQVFEDGKNAQKELMTVLEVPGGTSSYDVSRADGYNRVVIANLTVPTREYTIDSNGKSFSLDITSNWYWNITNTEDWITFSQTSGYGNQTITVTVKPYSVDEIATRYATIGISTQYGSVVRTTVNILQYHTIDLPEGVTAVNHIWSTASDTRITTNIYPSGINTRICFGAEFVAENGNIVVGCGTSGGDSADYRFFYTLTRVYFDMGNSRITGSYASALKTGDKDFTLDNYFVQTTTDGSIQNTGTKRTTAGFTATTGIKCNPYAWKFKYLRIFESKQLVFDGYAAIDEDGTAGIYDVVSQSWYGPTSGTLSYD